MDIFVQPLFAQATQAHNAGDFVRAEALYRQVLSVAPDHPDALHLLGRLALEACNAAAALGLIGRAVQLRPRIAEYQASLAEAQRAAGQVALALETLRRAVRLKPESALIQFGHGMALAEAGQKLPAIQAFRRAIARDAKFQAAHRALGAALLAEGQTAPAIEAFRAALLLAPRDAEAAFNLGCALQQQGEAAQAEAMFRAALDLQPGYLHAANNLGVLLQSAGRLEEAAVWLRRAAVLDRSSARACINLGLVLRDSSCFAEAEAAFREAEARCATVETLCCIGNTLRDQGQLAASEAALIAALARDPTHAETHVCLAFTRLLAGDLQAGWLNFRWRGARRQSRARVRALTAAPDWDGAVLPGLLLIYAEQGAGDFMQMARYIPLAAVRAGGVRLVVPPSLTRLAARIEGAALLDPAEAAHIEAVCPDLDLPGLFDTSLLTIPAEVPYLAADADEVAVWRERLEALPGPRVGIAWAGNPAYFHDRQRSVPADALAALAGASVSFVSLQPGVAPPPGLPMHDFTGGLSDFAATAALIEALDLVIAVDSAVAHLAGALGRKVWLLNRYAPDWRWLLGRDDSPWYPGLRQFRQAAPGDWAGTLAAVRVALDSGAWLLCNTNPCNTNPGKG